MLGTRLCAALLGVGIAFGSASPTNGGSNKDAKIACHLVTHVNQKGYNFCANAPIPPCNEGEQNLGVQGETGTPYDLYLLVADGDSSSGVAGAGFGISYKSALQSGVDVLAWNLCADAEYGSHPDAPDWPNAGSGNVIVWIYDENCNDAPAAGDTDGGVTAVLGVLYVFAYGNDIFAITKRPKLSPPEIAIADCRGNQYTLSYPQSAGKASFGAAGGGFDPCQ